MVKMTSALRFIIVFLIVMLLATSSIIPGVSAQSDDPPGGYIIFYSVTALPSKFCKGDKVEVVIAYSANYPAPSVFSGISDNGITGGPYNVMGGRTRQKFQFTVTATKPGGGFANFGSTAVSDFSENWDFEVVECEYGITFSAKAEEKNDKIKFVVATAGVGNFTASDIVGGSGTYDAGITPYYEGDTISESLACWITGSLEGTSGFQVSGSRGGDTVTVDIEFATLALEGEPELHCKDADDKWAVLGFLGASSVDPNKDIQLKGITFSSQVTSYIYPFTFGTSGSGKVEIWKRMGK